MKTKKLTIEAQQICLENVTEVFEALVKKFTTLEEEGRFREESTLELEPYNRGYQIKMEFHLEYKSTANKDFPVHIRTPFLHPGTFFEDYMAEGKDAYMEFGFMKADSFSGNSTGRTEVITMGQFKAYAAGWAEGMKKQIEEL